MVFRLLGKTEDSSKLVAPLPNFSYLQEGVECVIERVIIARDVKNNLHGVEYQGRCRIDLAVLSANGGAAEIARSQFLVAGMPYQEKPLAVAIRVSFARHPTIGGAELLTVARGRQESAQVVATLWSVDGSPLILDRLETSSPFLER